MTEQEIIKAISKVEGLDGMTINERLYVCGLMDEFDKALITDKKEARPSSDYPIHSHCNRTWEHLRLFQYRTFIHYELPIYRHKEDARDLQ